MRIYLDICTLNRPFDCQTDIRIRIETEAKLFIQEQIREGKVEFIWSYIADLENSVNPFEDRRDALELWKARACVDIEENDIVLSIAKEIGTKGVSSKDALHVACAIVAECSFFITTDDRLLKKLLNFQRLRVVNPVQFLNEFRENI